MPLNQNEVGSIIRVNVNEDLTGTKPIMILQPELGQLKRFDNGVTIGTITIVSDNETLNANEYIEYTTKEGDLDYVGRWRKKAMIDFNSNKIQQTDYVKFRVLA